MFFRVCFHRWASIFVTGDDDRREAKIDCKICLIPGIIALFVMLTPCSHVFHESCVDRLAREAHGYPRCPICRTPFRRRHDVRSLRYTQVFHDDGSRSSDSELGACAAPATSAATASNSAMGASSSVPHDPSTSAAAQNLAVENSGADGDALTGGLSFLFNPTDDADTEDDLPTVEPLGARAGSLQDESRSIPESLPELEDQLAAICVPRETPNRISGLGRIVRPSDLRRTLFHLMNRRQISASTPISEVYLRAVRESPSAARAQRDGDAGPEVDEEEARSAGRESLEVERLEMNSRVMAIELDAMFHQLQSYEEYHHQLDSLHWDMVSQFNASLRLLQENYVNDIRSARRFFRDHHPMNVQDDHNFIMSRSSMEQVASAIADALERGPGYDVLVDILGSRADGQRRNGPSVRRYHYAQTAPTGESPEVGPSIRISSSPVVGRGRRHGRDLPEASSSHNAQRPSSFSSQAGSRFRRGSSQRRGMVAGSNRGASDDVNGGGRRVGGGLLYRPHAPSAPASSVRPSSNDVVRPRDRAVVSRRASTSRGRRNSPAPRRDQASQRRQSQASQQQSNGRGAHVRRRGTTAAAAAAAASNAVSRESEAPTNRRRAVGTLTGDSALQNPSIHRPCALRRAAELRELLTGVDNFDIEEEVRRRERVVRRPDAGVEEAVRFANTVRHGFAGRIRRIQGAGWLSCDDAREEARLRVVREEDEALAAAAATAAAVSASAAAISASTAASAAAVLTSAATSAATSAVTSSTDVASPDDENEPGRDNGDNGDE